MDRPAEPSLTDTLCTRCGLCCDGTLFADVELAGTEVTRLEILGARIDSDGADGAHMLQPCAALCGTRCSIYAHRPRSCRSFECGLLQRARSGAVSVDRALGDITGALERIGRIRALLAKLGHRDASLPLEERCAEALASDAGGPRAAGTRAELEAAMARLRRTIRSRFMAGSTSTGRR